MSAIDPTVASHLDHAPVDVDEDELLESLENDTSVDAFREQRLQQLHEEYARQKSMINDSHGKLEEIREERDLMDIVTGTQWCIVHFFKSDFGKCGIMDAKLEEIAPKHFDTRFLRINVENAPFLVTKMKIQVLPCVVAFVKGAGVDRIIGFEGLGLTGDDFSIRDLELRLLKAGVLARAKVVGDKGLTQARPDTVTEDESDDEWE